MQRVIGVRFKKAGKIYYFSPGNNEIVEGDGVIVETARGVEFGTAVIGEREVLDSEVVLPLKDVIRRATPEDYAQVERNREQEKEAFKLCEKKIDAHKLDMKLIDVEYTFDVNKIIFYFTADGRIDFRELVKDLAAVFRTRIELRQIGVRDEAKMMGGIGGCGRPLCCATFLGEFAPVSIRMAKDQNLSLNPTKISGICGRLMCCLKYENDCYCQMAEKKKIQPPKQGARVVTVDGEGKVVSVNMQRRAATILLDDKRTIVAQWEDVIEKDEDTFDMTAPMEDSSDIIFENKEKNGEYEKKPYRDDVNNDAENIERRNDKHQRRREGKMRRDGRGGKGAYGAERKRTPGQFGEDGQANNPE